MSDTRKPLLAFLFASSVILLSAFGCSSGRKALKQLEENNAGMDLALPVKLQRGLRDMKIEQLMRDTLIIHDYIGKDVFVMNAIRDDGTEEMLANEVLAAALVSAQFRNVAERQGTVDLEFQVRVPDIILQSDWQLRLYPKLYIFDECTDLEPVVISGDNFRKKQIKGYNLYRKFLDSVVNDTLWTINVDQLELYLKRENPDLYALKDENSFVDEDYINSILSPEELESMKHYFDKFAAHSNNIRIVKAKKKHQQYLRAFTGEGGLHLDTFVVSQKKNFIFNYIETIKARPKLCRASIVFSGEILASETNKRIYTIPQSGPLTFCISSVSTFLDSTIVRYKHKVTERKAPADDSYNISFDVNKTMLDEDFGDNRRTVRQIKDKLKELMLNEFYNLDSIVVTAASSPEGLIPINTQLSRKRSECITDYFSEYVRDSLGRKSKEKIHFISRSIAENWDDLVPLVERDNMMTEKDKKDFASMMKISDVDRREYLMRIRKPWYTHLKSDLYPKVRTVRLMFAMHRKGMVMDTVHTREIDMDYKRGVQALEERDYETAFALLEPYYDYNTAIAALSLGRNYNARDILLRCEMTDKVHYLLAIVNSRLGEPEQAVKHYMESCRLNRYFVSRGKLDPEIYLLIKQYNLNAEPEAYIPTTDTCIEKDLSINDNQGLHSQASR